MLALMFDPKFKGMQIVIKFLNNPKLALELMVKYDQKVTWWDATLIEIVVFFTICKNQILEEIGLYEGCGRRQQVLGIGIHLWT